MKNRDSMSLSPCIQIYLEMRFCEIMKLVQFKVFLLAYPNIVKGEETTPTQMLKGHISLCTYLHHSFRTAYNAIAHQVVTLGADPDAIVFD